MKLIQAYFGGIGVLSIRKTVALWRVRSFKNLKIIIDHFDRYPLITKKRLDYLLFKEVFQMVTNKDHLTEEGIKKIVNLRAYINKGLSITLKEYFPDIKLEDELSFRKEFDINPKTINPYWMAGFTDAEGCFFVIIQENKVKGLHQIKLGYQVSQHVRDTSLIKSFKEFFECGRTEPCGRSGISFRVTKIKDLREKIIPFFDKYLILGSKSKDYQDWKKISKIMISKAHLRPEGLREIRQIKYGMNSLRQFPSSSSSD